MVTKPRQGPRYASTLRCMHDSTDRLLERARQDQHDAVSPSRRRNGVQGVVRADAHPGELDVERVQVERHADAAVEYPVVGSTAVAVLAVLPEGAAVRDKTNAIDERMRRVDFAVDRV